MISFAGLISSLRSATNQLSLPKIENDTTPFRPRPEWVTPGGQGIFNLFSDEEVNRVALAENSFLQMRLERFLSEEHLSQNDYKELVSINGTTSDTDDKKGCAKVYTFSGIYRYGQLLIEERQNPLLKNINADIRGKFGSCELRSEQCAPILKKIKTARELHQALTDPEGIVRKEIARLRDERTKIAPATPSPLQPELETSLV